MAPSDLELAERAAKGEREAFRQLLERHYALIYRLSYRFFGNMADAEDITQEICLGLAAKIIKFEGRSRFSTWLYTVAINACRDHERRRRKIKSLEETSMICTAHRMADFEDSEIKEKWLYEAINSLEVQLKETVLLVLAEELSHREAAEILGIAESTVSWRMHEARKRLKALVESAHG
jgi:RNA polymerase sigma-70 factor (ECF subfamily)